MFIDAMYITSWDDGSYVFETACRINVDTGEILIETVDDEDSEAVNSLDSESVLFNDTTFEVYFNDDLGEYFILDMDKFKRIFELNTFDNFTP